VTDSAPRSPVGLSLAARRARRVQLLEAANARAAATGAHGGAVLVPANTRPTVPLGAAARRRFLDRLGAELERIASGMPAAAPAAPDKRVPATTPAPAPSRTDAIIGATCSFCRGACCTAGGEHAFLRGEHLAAIRMRSPEASPAEFVARYASFLPLRHYRGSCVYHATGGCALPRELRSGLCNRYLCGGLTQLTRMDRRASVLLAATDGEVVRRERRLDLFP
jgi:hypothetical protein